MITLKLSTDGQSTVLTIEGLEPCVDRIASFLGAYVQPPVERSSCDKEKKKAKAKKEHEAEGEHGAAYEPPATEPVDTSFAFGSPDEPETPLTIVEWRSRCLKYVTRVGRPAAVAALGELGFKSMSDVPEDQWIEVLKGLGA